LNTSYAQCTWGFIAKQQFGTQRYIVTAGHCGKVGTALKHNAVTVSGTGGVDKNNFDMTNSLCCFADAMRAPTKSLAGFASPYNLVYLNSTEPGAAITGTVSKSAQAIGAGVCYVGRTSGLKCGAIETKSLDATVCRTLVDNTCKFMYDLVRMDKTASDGDSGGPALYGGKAYGIVTAKDPNHGNKMVYSAINEVESTLGVYTCTTAAC
jgi:hypothetical protein